jgi:hypothetical protein
MGKWKKIIFGEKMPDKNDPQYKERYDREVNAGRKFCSWLKLDKAACGVQGYASRHPKRFMAMVVTIILMVLTMNIYRIAQVCYSTADHKEHITATQHQAQVLKQKRQHENDNN